METIKTAAGALCATLVVTGIFTILVPNAGPNRFVKLAVRLFFLLCVATPFFQNRINLSLDTDRYFSEGRAEASNLTELAQNQLIDSFTGNLKTEISRILKKHGVTPQNIEIDVHIEDGTSIDITTIKITLEKEDEGNLGDALSEIKGTIGVPAFVEYAVDG